jgi:RHS repeat-associated protein
VFGPQTYTRGAGAPVKVKKTFRVDRPSGKYTLRVTNHGVTSGVISLNGDAIIDSDDFAAATKERDGGRDADQRATRDRDRADTDQHGADDVTVTILERPVTVLRGSNEIVVELRSKPGTSLDLEILGSVTAMLPVANPGGPYTGNVGQAIGFSGLQSTAPAGQTITSYAWNFGDNSAGTSATPSHTYASVGTFQVSLTVTDTSGGTNTASTTATVAAAPTANTGGPYTGTVNQPVTLNGTGSAAPAGQTITSYAWNFGDNSTGTGATPAHTYSSAGTFQISLVATDSTGGTNTATTTATITGLSITGFSPASGPIGTVVNVTLTLFTGTSGSSPQVTLVNSTGGSISAPVSSFSANALSFIVPAGAGSGKITITSGSQTAVSSGTFSVTTSSSFTLTMGPSSAGLIQGQQVTYAVALKSPNGFGGLATLAVTGVPGGVTAAFNPTAITGGQTSILTLTAPATQAASTVAISVTASATIDGQSVTQSATASLQISGITTSFVGRTVVDDAQQTPIAGVSIRFLGKDDKGNVTGCSTRTASDAGGNFALTQLPAACTGPQLISYDGLTATSPEGKFAGVNLSYTLIPGQVTASPVLIHLPRIDNAQTVQIQQNAPTPQIFTLQSLPAVRVTVYPGTTFTLDDGSHPDPFPLVAVEVPVDRLPDKMATSGLVMPFIVAFQPANAFSSQSVAVDFPNKLNMPPGGTATLMTLDPTRGYMVPYGTGTVTSDGTRIVPDPDPANPGHAYGLIHFDWHGPAAPPPPSVNPSPDPNGPSAGDPVDLASGLLVVTKTDIAFGGARGPIAIARTYRTLSSNPGPFGIGSSHNYGFALDTLNVVRGTGTLINLDMPDGNQLPLAKQPDGTFLNTTTPVLQGSVIDSPSAGTYNMKWKNGTVFGFSSPSAFAAVAYLNSITDSNGNVTKIIRANPSQPIQITQIIDPFGRKLGLTYDDVNRITSITDPIGRTVQYTYNSQGTLATVTDTAQGVTSYTYNSPTQLATIADPRGITYLQNSYDGDGRVAQQIAADGGITRFAYTYLNSTACAASGCAGVNTRPILLTTVTDPLGRQTTYHFSPQGLLLDVTDALGEKTVYTRDSRTNQVLAITDPLGRATAFSYDPSGNPTSITRLAGTPNAVTGSLSFDSRFNKVTSITDPLGHTTTFKYDGAGNLINETGPLGDQVTFAYDGSGEMVAVKDALGNTATATFANGSIATVTDPLSRVSSYVTDAVGRRVAAVDAAANTTRIQYDAMNQVTQITDPLGNHISFAFDGNGNLLSVTDANQRSTTYTYDQMDRVASRTDPLGDSEVYQYDRVGNLVQLTDRRGIVSTNSYDALNRPMLAGFGGQSAVTYTYDAASRLTDVMDSISGTVAREFDALDQLTSEVTPQGSVSYTYDAAGRRASMVVNGQPPVNYSYDNDNRVIEITQAGAAVGVTYDGDGRRASLSLPNGVVKSYAYDSASEETSLTYGLGSTILGTLSYAYDLAGRRAAVGGSFAKTGLPPALAAASYNADNQVTRSGSSSLSYDANGNLISDGVNTYTWDARNHLVSISGGVSANFQYDPFGRRVTTSVAATTKSFLYDSARIVEESSGGARLTDLLGGGLDEYFSRSDPSGTSYFLTDALGSTIALTDASGTLSTVYTYEPLGAETSTGSSQNEFQFTGRENDGTGLYFFRARYFSPQLGRFISEDPIGLLGGINEYAYVGNNPISRIDPFGLDWLNNLSDFSAATGSVLSFGLTDVINDATGASSVVNKCSGWYTAGTVAGIALTTAIGGAAGAEAAEAQAGEKGAEFSHWIPNRWGGPRSLWNGNYVSEAEHALNDPFRYRFMDPAWKALNPMNPAWEQQWNRIPLLLKGAGAGAAAGGASTAMNGRKSGCN